MGEFVTITDGKRTEVGCVLSLFRGSKYSMRLAIEPRHGDKGVLTIKIYRHVEVSPYTGRPHES